MKNKTQEQDLDYDTILIYPHDYDRATRQKLRKILSKIGVQFTYERY